MYKIKQAAIERKKSIGKLWTPLTSINEFPNIMPQNWPALHWIFLCRASQKVVSKWLQSVCHWNILIFSKSIFQFNKRIRNSKEMPIIFWNVQFRLHMELSTNWAPLLFSSLLFANLSELKKLFLRFQRLEMKISFYKSILRMNDLNPNHRNLKVHKFHPLNHFLILFKNLLRNRLERKNRFAMKIRYNQDECLIARNWVKFVLF